MTASRSAVLAILLLAGCGSWRVDDPILRDQLVRMAGRDQALRQQLLSGAQVDSAAVAAVSTLDTANQDTLERIIETHGWPRKKLVGNRGVGAAFLILQHADHDLQDRLLPQVRAAVEAGEIRGEALALLTDRLLVSKGRPQRYGTQAEVVAGQVRLLPIEDEATVDERRAALGMMPLARYRERLQKMLGARQ
jgi:hypothetical protein